MDMDLDAILEVDESEIEDGLGGGGEFGADEFGADVRGELAMNGHHVLAADDRCVASCRRKGVGSGRCNGDAFGLLAGKSFFFRVLVSRRQFKFVDVIVRPR